MSTLIEIEGENYMLNELITRYPLLESIRDEIERAYNTIVECYEHDGKVLIVGNGGSAADAEHIVGELMKGVVKTVPSVQRCRKHCWNWIRSAEQV